MRCVCTTRPGASQLVITLLGASVARTLVPPTPVPPAAVPVPPAEFGTPPSAPAPFPAAAPVPPTGPAPEPDTPPVVLFSDVEVLFEPQPSGTRPAAAAIATKLREKRAKYCILATRIVCPTR